MSEHDMKSLRKQLRAVTKDLLPETLSQELKQEVFKDVMTAVDLRLKAVETTIKDVLAQLDKRSKDTLDMLVRQSQVPSVQGLPTTQGSTVNPNQG